MRTPTENKLALDTQCTKCHQPARRMPTGVFCRSHGFIEDPETWIKPSPDPISQAIKGDPERVEAQQRMREAEAAYQATSDAWLRALSELQSVRLKAQHDEGSWAVDGSGWSPSSKVRQMRKREKELLPEIERLERAKARTEEDMQLARVEFQRLDAEVSRRHGRPKNTGNAPSEARGVTIPVTD